MVRHYSIEGRVQGVGFRWFVQREAAHLGLRGWVRNTDDGRVECIASGDDAQLATLLELLKKGSRGSRVDRLRVNDLQDAEADKLGPFEIEDAW
jgi:acylphosphatase